ncbi:MAG: PEP-CTERM sorting domain-containing protein [Caldimonas sp.]
MRTEVTGAVGVVIAAMSFAAQAEISDVSFAFNGLGFSGNGIFTIAPNVAPADPNPNCGTLGNNACRTDPPGAFRITGITGSFSNTTTGISNALITGLVPTNPANERDPVFDPLVPSSLSFVDYSAPTAGALTYNNLYFPGGSPIDCDFSFSGTFVDVFGVAFRVAGGYTVDLWGDGDMFGPGTTTYGVGVTDGRSLLAYELNGVDAVAAPVPEPSSLALLGGGLLGLLGWRRRSRRLDASV